jgi:hypothetical protein
MKFEVINVFRDRETGELVPVGKIVEIRDEKDARRLIDANCLKAVAAAKPKSK